MSWMVRQRRTALTTLVRLLALAPLLLGTPSLAEAPIKRLVVKNCDAAIDALALIKPEEREAVIQDLRLVLKLDLDTLPEEISPPPAPTPWQPGVVPPGEGVVAAIRKPTWRSFEASPEADAHACAAYLLSELAPSAASALRELVIVADDRTVPEGVRDLASAAALRIANVHRDQLDLLINPGPIHDLVALYRETKSALASRLLLHIGLPSVSYLLPHLGTCQDEECEDVAQLLHQFHGTGYLELHNGLLRALLNDSREDVRLHTLKLLVTPTITTPNLFPLLLERLDDPNDEIRATLFSSLVEYFQNHTEEALDPDQREILLHALGHESAGDRNAILAIIKSDPELLRDQERQLLALLRSTNPNTKSAALHALAHERSLSKKAFSLVSDIARDYKGPAQLAAIETLGEQRSRSADTITVLINILRKNLPKAAADRLLVYQTVGAAVKSLDKASLAAKISPYLVEGLSLSTSLPIEQDMIAQALLSIGRAARPALMRVSSRNKEASTRAKEILKLLSGR